ncbi:hypothetical protein ILYODFUR_036650 [Ilyodon furcidens]|uniref:Uncharacterized protein n=1 Tax=Ilyodon furcidens TaxID=33524 RepID=A0ABV0UNH4_9TELE
MHLSRGTSTIFYQQQGSGQGLGTSFSHYTVLMAPSDLLISLKDTGYPCESLRSKTQHGLYPTLGRICHLVKSFEVGQEEMAANGEQCIVTLCKCRVKHMYCST